MPAFSYIKGHNSFSTNKFMNEETSATQGGTKRDLQLTER